MKSDIKITIVYDNTTERNDITADWGFSCLIEAYGRKILFDTGGNGKILLHNMLSLTIDPQEIDDIVISHPDFDHIGGLSHLLNVNSRAKIHNPISFRGINYENEVVFYEKPTKIYDRIYVTGELGNREQALAIKTNSGILLVVGCGHPTLKTMIESISVFGDVKMIIGGFHGSQEYDQLENMTWICPTHCTKFKEEIKSRFSTIYHEGGVGKTFYL